MSVDFIDLISSENNVFRAYCFWSAILVIKMLAMAPLTGRQRFRHNVFANPEDTKLGKKAVVKFNHGDVERVRRAHRNDLENILPFFVVGFLYVLTNPDAACAINLFRAVAISRILHTIVYAVYVVPQPARALAWFVPFASSLYMAYKVMLNFL